MGLFGIKTRKEKQAEAERLRKAKSESDLLDSIEYWSYDRCYDELKAYESGRREHFSRRVVEKIKSKKQQLARERGENSRRRELDRKIAEKEKEIERLKARDPWTYTYGGGMYMKTRSTQTDAAMAAEVKTAERELARLRMERNNIGKEW